MAVDEKQAAEIRKIDAESQKLQLEAQQISRQFTFWNQFRLWLGAGAGVAAVATVFLSALSIFFSYFQAQVDQSAAELKAATELLGSEKQSQQIIGVFSMSQSFRKMDLDQQTAALNTLAQMLSVSEDDALLDAILVSFENPNLKMEAKQSALELLIRRSQTIVIRDNLWGRSREEKDGKVMKPIIAISQGIVALLRQDARVNNLSRIYCVDCDFSGLDLTGTSFDNAVLQGAIFRNSILKNATFNDADLLQTQFNGAELQNAQFRQTNRVRNTDVLQETNYFWAHLLDDAQSIIGPNFECANLTDADFKGHTLFGYSSIEDTNTQLVRPFGGLRNIRGPRFQGAQLNGVDFSELGSIGFIKFEQNGPHSSLTELRPNTQSSISQQEPKIGIVEV